MSTNSNVLIDPFAQEGYADYYDGVELNECPYEFDTDGEGGWRNGWFFAKKEEKNRQNTGHFHEDI
jgi:hypothetical protein